MKEDIQMMITGIDEAGRGALVGPMVIAGITIDSRVVKKLAKIGVKDSKMLSPKRREQLAVDILEAAKSKGVSGSVVIPIPSCKIDSYRKKKVNLNTIEIRTMAEIIDIIGGDKIYIDALTSRPDRFKQRLMDNLQTKRPEKDIIAENEADKKYTVVSAASIIAKVERDRAIEDIKRKVGYDFGVGYPHDGRTVEFVEGLIKSRKQLPSYVRKSWSTTQLLQEKNWQRKLKDFFTKDFIFGKTQNKRKGK
jgi:ribonuclease HII